MLVFLPVVDQPFLDYDDLRSVPEVDFIEEGLSVSGLRQALSADLLANWIPVTVVSHMLDFELWGQHPAGHYFVNLLLHAATAVLLFLFVSRATGRLWPSFVAVAFWAIHPLRVESVAWIAERKDVLSGCFAAAVLLAYERHSRAPSWRSYLTVGCLLALGLLAKPMLVTLPILLLLVDVWPLERVALPPGPGGLDRWRRVLLEKVPWIGLSVLAAGLAIVFQGREGQSQSIAPDFPLLWRLKNACLAAAEYVERTLLPRDLAAFYPLAPEPPSLLLLLPALLLLVATTGVALVFYRSRPWLAFGWLWFLLALAPVAGLIQVGRQASADRYTYLPGWGLAITLTWLVVSLVDREPGRARAEARPLWMIGAVVVLLLTLAGLTRAQLRHWQSSEALFARVVAVTPSNEVGHAGLGKALIARGELFDGTTQLVRALEAAPGRVSLYGEVAHAMTLQNYFEEAEGVLRKGIEVSRGDLALSRQLVSLLLTTGRLEEAESLIAELVQRYPDDEELVLVLRQVQVGLETEAGAVAEQAKSPPNSN